MALTPRPELNATKPVRPDLDVPIAEPTGRVAARWWDWLDQWYRWYRYTTPTDKRPTNLTTADAGFPAFDVTLNAPIWWTGAAWIVGVDQAAGDARYVNVPGDTMTGDLTIAKATPYISLDKPASGTNAILWGLTNGLQRWAVTVGNATAETGSGNTGSNFSIGRYADNGANLDTPIVITRSTGIVSFLQAPTVAGTALIPEAPTDSGYYMRRNGVWVRTVALLEDVQFFSGTDYTRAVATDAPMSDAFTYTPKSATSRIFLSWHCYATVTTTAAVDDFRARLAMKFYDDVAYNWISPTQIFAPVNNGSTISGHIEHQTVAMPNFDVSTWRRSNGNLTFRLYGNPDYASCTLDLYDVTARITEIQP